MRRFFLLLPLALLGCSDDHSHAGNNPLCAQIASRCHAYDTGSGTAHECHQFSEGNNVALCTSRQAECFAACPATPPDGGARDGGTDAGTTRDPICQLLGSRCHPYDDHDGGVGNQCHELGHANNAAVCAMRQAECLAFCPERDAGAHDASAHDATTSHDGH